MRAQRLRPSGLVGRRARRTGGAREGGLAVLLLLPSLVVVFGIIIYPLLRTLYTSFLDVDSSFPGDYPFVGLRHYSYMIHQAEFWSSIERTLYFTIVSTALELVLGLLVALLLNIRFRGRWLVRSVVILPWALPTVVSGAMWRWIFNAEYGALNALLTQTHIMGDYQDWLGSPWVALNMVVIADVWKLTPLAALLMLAGLQTIPHEVYEAAVVDGADAVRRFFTITLPLLMPTILIVLVLRTIDAFRLFDVVYVMTRGGPANGTETIAYYTYLQAFSNQLFSYGAALAYVIAFFILLMAMIYMRLLRTSEVQY